MIPLLLLLPLLFLLAVLGQDSENGEPQVVVNGIQALRSCGRKTLISIN